MIENSTLPLLYRMVWAEIERALFSHLTSFVEYEGGKYVGRKTTKSRAMVMTDPDGQNYRVDGVILDESLRPLALVETPGFVENAIQVCEAHQAIKQKHTGIKKSLVVAVDSWSEQSVTRFRSCGISLIQIPLQHIRFVLAQYNIEFDQRDQGDNVQTISRNRLAELSLEEKNQIGHDLIAPIESEIKTLLAECFTDFDTPAITRIRIELESNQGEVTTREFTHLPEAVYFLHFAEANNHELWG